MRDQVTKQWIAGTRPAMRFLADEIVSLSKARRQSKFALWQLVRQVYVELAGCFGVKQSSGLLYRTVPPVPETLRAQIQTDETVFHAICAEVFSPFGSTPGGATFLSPCHVACGCAEWRIYANQQTGSCISYLSPAESAGFQDVDILFAAPMSMIERQMDARDWFSRFWNFAKRQEDYGDTAIIVGQSIISHLSGAKKVEMNRSDSFWYPLFSQNVILPEKNIRKIES